LIFVNPWKEIRMLKAQAEKREEFIANTMKHVIEMESALWEISELETPRASNVVKKAARIARKAIGWVA
jgi:hypothetical protein